MRSSCVCNAILAWVIRHSVVTVILFGVSGSVAWVLSGAWFPVGCILALVDSWVLAACLGVGVWRLLLLARSAR
jgi:hypothetical protein